MCAVTAQLDISLEVVTAASREMSQTKLSGTLPSSWGNLVNINHL